MPAAALSYSTTTTRLPTPSSASSQKTPTSALKRKWELSGEVNSISSTKPSKKSMKRKVRIADPSATTEMSAQYYSTSSSPSDASQSLAQQQQPSPSNTGSTSNNTSDPSLTAFHRSMFQSYVKNALDDLEKVCYVDCGKITRGAGRGRLIYKKNAYLHEQDYMS